MRICLPDGWGEHGPSKRVDIRSATRRRPPHRPWKPASAWAVLAAADCSLSSSLAPYQRHRARKRLGAGLANILANLSERARRRTFYAHPADVVRIVSEPGAVRTAASAAEELGIDLVGDGPAEAYVRQSLFNRIASAYHIEERAERPNMVLRIVADADWPFPEGTVTAPRGRRRRGPPRIPRPEIPTSRVHPPANKVSPRTPKMRARLGLLIGLWRNRPVVGSEPWGGLRSVAGCSLPAARTGYRLRGWPNGGL